MRSAFDQTRTLTKCALQAKFLFSNFTEYLQFEEKKEYVEILSMLICTLKGQLGLYYALRLRYVLVISYRPWLCAKDSICGAKLRI